MCRYVSAPPTQTIICSIEQETQIRELCNTGTARPVKGGERFALGEGGMHACVVTVPSVRQVTGNKLDYSEVHACTDARTHVHTLAHQPDSMYVTKDIREGWW